MLNILVWREQNQVLFSDEKPFEIQNPEEWFQINFCSATLPGSPSAKKQLLDYWQNNSIITTDITNKIDQAGILTAINCVTGGR